MSITTTQIKNFVFSNGLLLVLPLAFFILLSEGLGNLGFCTDSSPGIYVAIKEMALVRGDKIYLKDISDFHGPAQFQKSLGETYLAISPGPGKSKTLPSEWVYAKIHSSGKLPEGVTLKGPNYVRVERSFQKIETETLEQYYVNYIKDQLKGGNKGPNEVSNEDFSVSRFRVSGNGPLPEGKIRIELAPRGNEKWMGNVCLKATLWVSNRIERRLVLSGWVDRFEEVVCLQRPLSRHGVIAADDVAMERRNVASLPFYFMKSIKQAIGQRAKHRMKAGEVLMTNDIEKTPTVNKGDRVTIVAESSTISITSLGIAQEAGSQGDLIPVKNTMSDKEVMASVVDSNTVRVGF